MFAVYILLSAVILWVVSLLIAWFRYNYNRKYKCPKCRFRYTCHLNKANKCYRFKEDK